MPAEPRSDLPKRLLIRPGAIGDCIVSLPALESLSSPDAEIRTARQNTPVIRPGAIGDCIVSRPALESLSSPDAEIRTGRQNTPVIRPGLTGDSTASLPSLESLGGPYAEVWIARQNTPLIRFADRVRALPDTGLDLLEIPGREPPPALLESLRQFDSIISWYGANRSEFRDRVAALGLPFHFLPALPPGGDIHASDYYLAQALSLGGAPADPVPRIPCAAQRRNFAVIHPFSGSPRKNWPLDQFRALASRLDIPVEWTAGPTEPLSEARRFDDLYDLAYWLASACLYIGNDSGITHLAAAVGVPVIAIFLSSDPNQWAPRGAKVRVFTPSTLDQIPSAIASLLARA